MLTLVHAGHQGLEATLRRARTTIFWPGITNDIRQHVELCVACAKDSPDNQKTSLRLHYVPTRPWLKVGVDLMLHKGTNYIVIVDYHSDYFELEELSDTIAESTIKAIKKVFARFGVSLSRGDLQL
ncbi:Uncharacterised protein r2_g1638 [Pycnogonum litorale]